MKYIYLDNAATTAQGALVTQEINRAGEMLFYNSAALYPPSLFVKQQIEAARQVILKRLCASGEGELVFTSGATESNNIVIIGKSAKHGRVLLLEGEHSSCHIPIKHLKDGGYEVDMIPIDKGGKVDLAAFSGACAEIDTAKLPVLVVFGLVNSDTGTVQDARAFVQAVRAVFPRAHIHCDATQAFCKIPFDAAGLDLDSVAVSAHKIGGPKGIGALWMKKGANIRPLIMGGGQQTLRPGTENTGGVLGFACAVQVFDTEKNMRHVAGLHSRLVTNLPKGCTVNGVNNNPYITNIQLPNLLGQAVMNALAANGVLVGLGSACASNALKNRTLLAMGISDKKTKQVIRVSFSPENTISDVDTFIAVLKKVLANLVA